MSIIHKMRTGKVKLKFGDPEQIKAVKMQAKIHDEVMENKLFDVALSIEGTLTVRVRAKDEKEAKRVAKEDGFEVGDLDVDDVEVDQVDEVHETLEEKKEAIEAAIKEAS